VVVLCVKDLSPVRRNSDAMREDVDFAQPGDPFHLPSRKVKELDSDPGAENSVRRVSTA